MLRGPRAITKISRSVTVTPSSRCGDALVSDFARESPTGHATAGDINDMSRRACRKALRISVAAIPAAAALSIGLRLHVVLERAVGS